VNGDPKIYPRAEGAALDALADKMGLKRGSGQSDVEMRRRIVALQRFLHDNDPGPNFVGELPPSWVFEKNIDGSWTWP